MSARQIFKRIKRKIRRHRVFDLLDCLQALLFQPDATKIEHMASIEYWHLLLLFKWVIQYGEYCETTETRPVGEADLADLLNDMKRLSYKVFVSRNDTDRFLLFRSMCYQQFWVQSFEQIAYGLARQYELFAKLETNHSLQRAFCKKFGVSLSDFIEFSFALFAFGQARPRTLTPDSFTVIRHAYGLETIERFLQSVSIPFHDIPNWLESLPMANGGKYTDLKSEFHEQTPFLRFPLLEAPESYICVSPRLLEVSMSSIVFDMLREIDKDAFMARFGNLFERYVERSLRLSSCQFLTEQALMDHLGGSEGSKVVDFMVVEQGNTILIETKGVALSPKAMVAKRPGTVVSASKSSLIKGIEQAYDVASRLADLECVGGTVIGTKNTYLLVVTFKAMFVGNGETFRNFIAPGEIDRIISDAGGKEWIPLSNIFFISVDELDLMLGYLAKGSHTLSDFLEHAKEHQKKSLPKLYSFRNNIFEVSGRNGFVTGPLLSAAREELFERVRCKMSA